MQYKIIFVVDVSNVHCILELFKRICFFVVHTGKKIADIAEETCCRSAAPGLKKSRIDELGRLGPGATDQK